MRLSIADRPVTTPVAGGVPDLTRLLSLAHLDHLTDDRGLFEHAEGTAPRPEHGYCTDDNARLLIVATDAGASAKADRLARVSLGFVLAAQDVRGNTRNRMNLAGEWTDEPSTDDCWGRSLWGLGVATARHADPALRRRARRGFNHGVRLRSTALRSMAFAALGAVEVLSAHPDHQPARRLAADYLDRIGPPTSSAWRWPEPTLRYANASLADATIGAGAALGRTADVERGLEMLTWLLERETVNGHLSVAGAGDHGPSSIPPLFDQQPIEVAALADACARAAAVTSDDSWWRGVRLAESWLLGGNDAGLVMVDPVSGGGYDGLCASSVNTNQGAESTMAATTIIHRAQACPR
jgi:hypothetical protein